MKTRKITFDTVTGHEVDPQQAESFDGRFVTERRNRATPEGERMTPKEAEKLKVGDRLICKDDGAEGHVSEIGYCGAIVKWEDGQVSNRHFDDFGNFTRAVPARRESA